MDLRQLEIFVSVAKTLSFSKTAQVLYVSQPTVSATINALEKTVGIQLFIRNTKEVVLTKAGADFLVYAQRMLVLREQALKSVSGGEHNMRGDIDIISSTIPAQHLLPEIIASFRERWPDVVFHVEQTGSRQVEQRMSGFRYDFAMVGAVTDGARFVRYPVYDDELVLAVPPDARESAEAIRRGFSEYILSNPFIMRERGSGTRAEIESLLTKTGIDPCELTVPAYFPDSHSILLAVSRGMGVSIVSKVATAMHVEAGLLRTVAMHSPLFRRKIYLLHNKELWLSPVQEAFAEHVRGFYCDTN